MALGVLILVPVLLWLWSDGAGSNDQAPGRVTAAGIAAGLAAIAAFSLNIVLGARLPLVQRVFGGVGATYALHRANGRVVYLLVVAHVCLIVAGRGLAAPEEALRLFTPSAGAAVLWGLAAFLVMTGAIYLTLYRRLTHETFVYVQRVLGATFALAAAHVFLTNRAIAASPALTIYLAVLAVAAAVSFIYRSVLGDLLVRRFDYVVTQARRLDPEVVEIAMSPQGRALKAIPGQFVFVTFYSDRFNAQFHPISLSSAGSTAVVELRPGHARDQFHPFSLTSAPSDQELKLVVKAVGTFTRALHMLEPGAAARIEGPYGEFSYLNVDNPRQVWLAGGIGITPFLSMARSLEPDDREITLYHGVKTRAEAFFAAELEEIAARVPGFQVRIVPEDEIGFITVELIARGTGLERIDFLLVGPPAMEESLTEQLVAARVPRSSIHSERFAFGPKR